MGRVDGERGEHRVDRAAEEAVHLLLLFGGEVVPAHDPDPGFGERRRTEVWKHAACRSMSSWVTLLVSRSCSRRARRAETGTPVARRR